MPRGQQHLTSNRTATRAITTANTSSPQTITHERGGPRWRWLMATALPCADRQAVAEVRLFIASHASSRMHVRANLFDANALDAKGSGTTTATCIETLLNAAEKDAVVSVSRVPGHKTLFWRRDLTPSAIARYDLIWLLDCDVRVSSHLLSFRSVEHWLQATRSSIVQPSVIPLKAGGRAGRGSFTRTSLSADCLAKEMPFMEQMTPILRRGAFERVWNALTTIPDEYLGSDSGIDVLWCGLASMAYPQWPACSLLLTQSVVHMNTHTIHRFDKQEREHYFGKLNLYQYLQHHFDREMRAAFRISDADLGRSGSSGNGTLVKWSLKSLDEWHARGSKMNPNASASRGCWGL